MDKQRVPPLVSIWERKETMSGSNAIPVVRIHFLTGVLALTFMTGCQVAAHDPTASPTVAASERRTPALEPSASSLSRTESPAPFGTPSAPPSPRGGFVQSNASSWHFWSERFHGEVASVTKRGGQLVAVGIEGPTTVAAQTRPINSRLWTSSNASEWNSVDLPEDVGRSGFGAVYTSATGDLVVIGKFGAWTSPDTETWTAIDVPTVSDPLVATGPGGFLMTDRAPNNSPLWESEDGIDWQPLEIPGIEEGPRIISLAVGDSGRLVSACKPNDDFERPAETCRIYSSIDGTTWTPTEWLPTLVHVVWTGEEWLAAGYIHDDVEPRIQLWRAGGSVEWVGSGRITEGFVNPIVDLLLVAGERLVLKAGTSYTRSFISLDGSNWAPSGFSGGYIHDASELAGQLVVTGSTFDGLAAIWRLDG